MAKFKTGTNTLIRCRGCGRLTHSSVDGCLNIGLCRECLDDAGAENIHLDRHDAGHADPNCRYCRAEGWAGKLLACPACNSLSVVVNERGASCSDCGHVWTREAGNVDGE